MLFRKKRRFATSLLGLVVVMCWNGASVSIAADTIGSGKSAASVTGLPGWCLGPFTKTNEVNPIISPQATTTFLDPMSGQPIAWEYDHTFNPAAAVRKGKVYVLYRSEDEFRPTQPGEGEIGRHTSRLGLAESKDGLHFTRRSTPVLYPDNDAQKEYEWRGGCEDPRCVETEDGGYVLTYTQWNRKTPRLAIATSRDLVHWDKHGPAFALPDNGRFLNMECKSGAILTRLSGDHLVAAKIDGKYWMYWGEGDLRLATSPDLIHWDPVRDKKGDPLVLFSPRRGKFDSALVEAGPPAIVTDKGIVMLYNGKNADGDQADPAIKAGAYSGGQALFDSKNPSRLLDRTDTYFITPQASYEASGQYAAGTVFIEGLVHFRHKWMLYYGTADSNVALATAPAP